MIKFAKTQHISQCIEIQKNSLSKDILSELNNYFLFYLFFESCINNINCFFLVNEEKGTVTSFIIILKNPSKFFFDLLKASIRNYSYTLHAFLLMIKNVHNFTKCVLFLKPPINEFFVELPGQMPEIKVIATRNEYQNKGYGTQLLNYALKLIDNKCIVKTHSEKAAQFYIKNGGAIAGYERTGLWKLTIFYFFPIK